MVKDSQNWGQTLTQCLETAGSRLCPKEHWQPKDSARGLGLVQLRVTLTLGPQDSGTPSGEPPPTSLDKAQLPPPFKSHKLQPCPNLLPSSSGLLLLQPSVWISKPRTTLAGGSELTPGLSGIRCCRFARAPRRAACGDMAQDRE